MRVLEVAMYGFVPSAGAVLSDWGADVIKVEHAVNGDPQRGLRQIGTLKVEGDLNPNVEHANRGKRSIGLHLGKAETKEVLHELIRRSDVFLTSFLPEAREKFGIDVDDVRKVNPQIVYARGSALGPRGPEAARGGYDMTAFWARGSTAASLTAPGTEGMIMPPGPAYGDTISGTNLAGGIAAALFRRERTGETSVVDVSLLGSGVWAMGHGIALSAHLDQPLVASPPGAHGAPTNPLSGLYRTADGRYLSFVMLQPAKFWADVCRHVGRPEAADDPRFATAALIAENTAAGVEILREAIGSRTLIEWTERFGTLAGPWAPVQDSLQVTVDPQVRANDYLVQAGELELAASPVQFDVTAPPLSAAPEFAALVPGQPVRKAAIVGSRAACRAAVSGRTCRSTVTPERAARAAKDSASSRWGSVPAVCIWIGGRPCRLANRGLSRGSVSGVPPAYSETRCRRWASEKPGSAAALKERLGASSVKSSIGETRIARCGWTAPSSRSLTRRAVASPAPPRSPATTIGSARSHRS
ncbi:hypothetical protein GCM10010468_19790 [Actinocorallia longicatena]|uniref:Crotonobetainyl-CoA:carnitine CoA-transferase CaiB-like acyl-CoA transferase n=1 Tax=Actinocorallia longicatena TaxID=111803 RepID=A0ABP6Q511_9ACTN